MTAPASPPDESAEERHAVQPASIPWATWWKAALLLAVATVAVYAQVRGFDFVSFDDDVYVTANPPVQSGLNARSIAWALTTGHGSNWHPLIWLSLMLDVEMYGLNPAGFHLTNLLLHLLNALLLFYFFTRTTGRMWPSFAVAALFALHPLHVESVAWVTERKDTLSTFFFLVTLLAYARYAAAPSSRRFGAVAGCYALGLMSKPMLVTLPFLLLLLDYWPLQRLDPGSGWGRGLVGLIKEKGWLFALAALSSLVTFLVQHQGGAVGTMETYPLAARAANAAVAYVVYLVKTIWPAGLAFFYPYPVAGIPAWQVMGAVVLLLAATVPAVAAARRHPYVLVGWLWYVGMLVPVIGLVQVGEQSRADRYTYIPLIGIFLALSWGVAAWGRNGVWATRMKAVATGIALILLGGLAWRQAGTWRNDVTLCEHALRVTAGNYKAHNNLGLISERRGDNEAALAHYRAAVAIRPNHERHYNLGNAYRRLGQTDEALAQYRKALSFRPGYARALNNMGAIWFERGDLDRAGGFFQRAVEAQPASPEYHNNLGAVLQRRGDLSAAARQYSEAVRLDPTYTAAQENLHALTRRKGEAVAPASGAVPGQ